MLGVKYSTIDDVLAGRSRWCVVQADALHALRDIPPNSIDLVATDPPYSSGATSTSARKASTGAKYGVDNHYPDFEGDARDQRSYLAWCALWLSLARGVSTRDARCIVFSDWRQLPVTADALQAGGWIWRGVVPWDKRTSRPVPTGFRSQCEYALWGTLGPLPRPREGVGTLPGIVSAAVRPSERLHQVGKPVALMRELVRLAPPDGVVLDLFAGSGTTGVAALREGRRAILVELSGEYSSISRERLVAE